MGGWRSMDLDVVDLIYYLRSYQQILKYINLEPKETTPLGSCIGTWNELLGKKRKKKESGAGGSALSSSIPGFGSTPRRWPRPILHPSHRPILCPSHRPILCPSHRPILCLSHRLVVCPSRWWFNPLGSKPRSWVLLGFTLRRWALPFVVGFYPSSLGSTPHRCALPFVVGSYPSSLGSAFHHWVLPLDVVEPLSMSWHPYRYRRTAWLSSNSSLSLALSLGHGIVFVAVVERVGAVWV